MKKILISFIIVFLFFGCNKIEYFYISNVNVVDIDSGLIIDNQFIELQNGVISNIDDMKEFPDSPENSFNGNSMYLTPGLTDMNVSIGEKMADIDFWQIHPGDRMIASGVTTIRAGSNYGKPGVLVDFEDDLRGNLTIGPNIIKPAVANYSSGKNIESLKKEIKTFEADYIQMLNFISENEMNNILNFANEQNIYTSGNVYSFDDFIRCSEKGFDEILSLIIINILLMNQEFASGVNWFDADEYWKKIDSYYSKYYNLTEEELLHEIEPVLSKIIDVMKTKNIGITTALVLDEISAMKIKNPEKYFEYGVKYKIPEFIDSIKFSTEHVYADHFRLELIPEFVIFQEKIDRIFLKRLKEEGILILAGTELSSNSWFGIAPGISLHDELRILVECGFTNLEALQTVTLNPSIVGERMGVEFKWGKIVEGYNADFIFTEENPLTNIDILREPKMVMKNGRLYSENELKVLR
jgi:Amidohydrolase family